MDYPEKKCARDGCPNKFKPKAHNGCYCSSDCRTIATNKKILERYHEKRRQLKLGEKRICKTKGCGTVLSKYNSLSYCSICVTKKTDKKLKRLGWSDWQIRKSKGLAD